MSASRLEQVLCEIDRLHSEDPENESNEKGELVPKELLYARRMTACYQVFCDEPNELLSIAIRSQHLCRWEKKRLEFPEGRKGYFQWRRERATRAAELAAGALGEAGYEQTEIDRVRSIVEKRGLHKDPQVQALEDVACLVFLEHYLEDFAKQHNEDKLIDVIAKTWRKMSSQAHKAALELDFSKSVGDLVTRAVSG